MHTRGTPPAVDSLAANAAFPTAGLQVAPARPVETRRRQTRPPAERPKPVMLKKTRSCSCRRSNKPHQPAKGNSESAVFFTSSQFCAVSRLIVAVICRSAGASPWDARMVCASRAYCSASLVPPATTGREKQGAGCSTTNRPVNQTSQLLADGNSTRLANFFWAVLCSASTII